MKHVYTSTVILLAFVLLGTYTNAQNVGIGQSSPVSKLDIAGGLTIGSTYSGSYSAPANGLLVEGNTGIGTTSPNNKLDVNGTVEMTGIKITSSPVNGYVLVSDAVGTGTWADPASLNDNDWLYNGTHLYNANSGNVGVGTSTPGRELEVYTTSSTYPARVGGVNGYLDFGPANTSWSHFSTDRPLFYFSTGMHVASGEISSYGSTDLKLQTNGTNRLYVLNSNGNVGIGTTSPGEKLEVAGNISMKNGSDAYIINQNGYIGFRPNDATHGLIIRDYTGASTSWSGIRHVNSTSDRLEFSVNNSSNYGNSLVLDEATNVGIGTNSPTQKLDINGQVRIRGGSPADGKVLMATDGNGNATWADPADRTVEYSGTVTAGNWYRIAQNNSGGRRASAEFTLRDNISGGGHSTLIFTAGISYNYASGMSFAMTHHNWYSTPTFTKIRILHNGTYDDQYIEVYCNRSGSVRFTVENNFSDDAWSPLSWTAGSIPGGYTSREFDVTNTFVIGDYDDRLTVAKGGNVGIGYTSPSYALHVNGKVKSDGITETSDIRMKKNIKGISDALAVVLQLRGVTYEWNRKKFPDRHLAQGEQVGLIAQEVEKAYPLVVSTDNEGYKSIEYSHLVPLLIEAMKEQQQTINELKQEVTRLNAAISGSDDDISGSELTSQK